jgi:hypothetical protein
MMWCVCAEAGWKARVRQCVKEKSQKEAKRERMKGRTRRDERGATGGG